MIDEKKLIEAFETREMPAIDIILSVINSQPKVGEWNVITYCEEDGYLYNLPEDGQRVLVSYKGHVSEEEFIDGGEDGVYLDSGMDVDVGMAWQPLPEPYQFVDVNKVIEMEGEKMMDKQTIVNLCGDVLRRENEKYERECAKHDKKHEGYNLGAIDMRNAIINALEGEQE